MTRLGASIALLLVASGCGRQGGAVRVVVSFAQFEPGCLEVSAADSAGGEPELVQLAAEKLSGGSATIGVSPNPAWSPTLKLRVRSFEKTCEGPALEEFSDERTLEPGAVSEWQVTLTARDGDGDGFAAAAPGVNGGDCDDSAAARNPAATEACGALDIDCDGLAGCFDPQCVGRACDDGSSTTLNDVCTAGACNGTPLTTCEAGTFVTQAPTPTSDRVCTACSSGTFTVATNAASCSTWSDCAPGQRISVAPSSTNDRVCVPCEPGTFTEVPNSSTCATVGSCAPGSAPSVPATMTMPVQCTACVAGTHCAGGVAAPVPCGNGTWDDDTNPASACAPWTQCAAGFALSTPGSATTNASCSACAAGSYCAGGLTPLVPCGSGTWDHDASSATACSAWTSCAPGSAVSAAGSATTDQTCAACAIGNFCPGGATASTPCASGTWDHDASSGTACVAWAECSPGSSVTTPGSTTVNRACTACTAGTFSTTTNAATCTPWAACVPGEFISTPGSVTTNQGCTACATGTFTAAPNTATCSTWSTCAADTYQAAAPTSSNDRLCSHYTSCLDRLTRVPSTPSGPYVIDPDGTGALPTITVTCDMTTDGGGWTVISFDDFSTNATGWSDGRRDTTSNCFDDWGEVLGGYNQFGNGATTTKVLNLRNITHTRVRVSLDYFIIDSWDNERARVSLDGTPLFNNQFTQGGSNICGGIWLDRGPQAVVGAPAHTANVATLTVTSTLDQGAGDESWAIDDVLVMIR